MAERIPQSATIRVPLLAYLLSDHVTRATGKTIAVTISKNGAAFGNPSAGATNAVEVSGGLYYVDLSTTDTNTLGPLAVNGAEGTIDTITTLYNVNTDAALLATLTAYVDTEVAAIKAKTDNLPTDPADASDIAALFTALNTLLSTTGVALTAAERNAVADALLGRNVSGGSSSGRTVKQALHFIRNKWAVLSNTLTVYDTDDVTTSWTAPVTGTPGADPITGIDPT